MFVEFAQIERISPMLANQINDVIVRPAGDAAGDGVVRLEDQPAAFGRIELAQDLDTARCLSEFDASIRRVAKANVRGRPIM